MENLEILLLTPKEVNGEIQNSFNPKKVQAIIKIAYIITVAFQMKHGSDGRYFIPKARKI